MKGILIGGAVLLVLLMGIGFGINAAQNAFSGAPGAPSGGGGFVSVQQQQLDFMKEAMAMAKDAQRQAAAHRRNMEREMMTAEYGEITPEIAAQMGFTQE